MTVCSIQSLFDKVIDAALKVTRRVQPKGPEGKPGADARRRYTKI